MNVFIDRMSESTFEEKEETFSRFFVVYDRRTGRVLHVHQSVGDARFVEDRDHHARTALQMAGERAAGRTLEVLHVPADVRLQGGVSLYVNVSSGELEVSDGALSFDDFVTGIPQPNARTKVTGRKAVGKKARSRKLAGKRARA